MNILHKNESGFSAIEAVVVLVIVVLIGTVGWLVYKNHHKTTTPVITTYVSKAKKTTITSPASTTIVKIPDLGIEVSVPTSINDLTYAYRTSTTGFGNNEQLRIANLSTASLTALDSNCSASSQTALGGLGEANGTYPTNAYDQADVGQLVKQFPNFYVSWFTSQASCTFGGNTPANTLLKAQEQVVDSTFSNASSVALIN
jgi:hypothetical protein